MINDHFALDASFEPFLAIKSPSGEITKRIPITNPLEKGYVYASLFFYDEAAREVGKLNKMVKNILDEINQIVVIEEPAKLLMELSARVRNAIGDDSLDAYIKEVLAENQRAISLLPTEEERKKLAKIKEAIFTELFDGFLDMTFRNTTESGDFRTFKFTTQYVDALTERQKKLVAPALKMAGFIDKLRLDDLELLPDWSVRFKPARLSEGFGQKEDEIKTGLKKLMETHLINDTEND